MSQKVEMGDFQFRNQRFVPDAVGTEVEGAFLGVVSTFREIGVEVTEGFTSTTSFTFFLRVQAKKRWFAMARMLVTDHRGYLLRIGKMLMPYDRPKFQWMVSIEADNIVAASSHFRRSLYGTWDLVQKVSVYNGEDLDAED